jgi:hypothetical protein
VLGEQGLGDELMFARFVPLLRSLAPRRITLACMDLNIRAFQHLGADVVCSRINTTLDQIERPDAWVLMGSLPARLGFGADLPNEPYLRAEPRPNGRIGLVAKGRPQHLNDANRSMPLEILTEAFPDGLVLEPGGDMQDTLNLVSSLDHLVTVDTSWAHAAGALGTPVSILLPAIGCDWRWISGRSDSPWYPSARLFHQPRRGDWTSVVDDVRAALRPVPKDGGALGLPIAE